MVKNVKAWVGYMLMTCSSVDDALTYYITLLDIKINVLFYDVIFLFISKKKSMSHYEGVPFLLDFDAEKCSCF